MKNPLPFLLTGFFSLASAHAAILVHEGFDYTAGTSLGATTNGGTGWGGAWSVTSGSAPTVDVTQLSPLTNVGASGLSVTQSGAATTNSVTRTFSTAYGTGVTIGSPLTIWLAFEMKGNGSNSNDSYLALLRNSGTAASDEIIRIGRKSGVSGGNITLSTAAGTSPTQTAFGNVAYNTSTYLMVVKLELQRSGAGTGTNVYTANLWSFTGSAPTSEGSLGASVANFTTTTLGSGTGLNALRLVDASSGANSQFDEIRIGTTFIDVIPEPSAAALSLLGGAILLRRRRK